MVSSSWASIPAWRQAPIAISLAAKSTGTSFPGTGSPTIVLAAQPGCGRMPSTLHVWVTARSFRWEVSPVWMSPGRAASRAATWCLTVPRGQKCRKAAWRCLLRKLSQARRALGSRGRWIFLAACGTASDPVPVRRGGKATMERNDLARPKCPSSSSALLLPESRRRAPSRIRRG